MIHSRAETIVTRIYSCLIDKDRASKVAKRFLVDRLLTIVEKDTLNANEAVTSDAEMIQPNPTSIQNSDVTVLQQTIDFVLQTSSFNQEGLLCRSNVSYSTPGQVNHAYVMKRLRGEFVYRPISLTSDGRVTAVDKEDVYLEKSLFVMGSSVLSPQVLLHEAAR